LISGITAPPFFFIGIPVSYGNISFLDGLPYLSDVDKQSIRDHYTAFSTPDNTAIKTAADKIIPALNDLHAVMKTQRSNALAAIRYNGEGYELNETALAYGK
jgi:hypothetical protein